MGNSKFNRLVSVGASILFTVLELVASLVLSVVFAPFLFLLWLTNETVRLGISGIFYFQAKNPQNPKMSLVSEGADAIWAFRKPGNSRNIIILYIYNSRMSLDVFRRNYDEKVIKYVDAKGRRPYEKLTTTFKRKFGYYCWAECKTFDIKNHIRNIHKDGREDEVVTETEVLQFMSTLTGDMSEAQPQWEEILVPRFAYDEDAFNGMDEIPERSARIYRSHHAYMDGCSNLLMAGTCMGDPSKSFPYVLDPTAPIKVANWKQVAYKVTCVIFGLTTVLKSIYAASRIKSRFLMKTYSGKQNFTWSPALDLSMIRSIKDKTNVSVPAILSSVTIGALKKLEETFPNGTKRRHEATGSTSLGLVGAILPYPDIRPKNRFTVVNFTTRGAADGNRMTRLATIQKDMRKLTQSPDGLVAYTIFQIFGKLPAFMIQSLLGSARTPVIYSNVPWASQMVKLWDQEVNDVAGWMPLLTFAGMGLLSVTYSDKVRLCIITDDTCLSGKEVQFLIHEVQKEIQLLFDDCSVMPHFKDKGILPV